VTEGQADLLTQVFLFSCSLRLRNLVNLVNFYKVSLASLAMIVSSAGAFFGF
jgi:hypothetical protein